LWPETEFVAEPDLQLILRLLQALQTELRSFHAEVIERLGRLERVTADLKNEVAALHGDFAGQSVRMDGMNARLERVERRLDLIGPPDVH
jgi:hypothetical protein